jgi:hypothetical protein
MLEVSHMGGLTSCLSIIFHEASKYRHEHGHWPEGIDASGSFITCRDNRHISVTHKLIAASKPCDLPAILFDHGQQFAHYHHLPLTQLQALAKCYAWPSSEVGDRAYNISKARGGRTCVIYRGNDKMTETQRTPYDKMFEAARATGGNFMVLTDELEFFEAFMDQFPNTVAAPGAKMIPRDPSKVITGGSDFAVNFLAALYSFAGANRLITTTGNTGLWPVIWRGTIKGVWQVRP